MLKVNDIIEANFNIELEDVSEQAVKIDVNDVNALTHQL